MLPPASTKDPRQSSLKRRKKAKKNKMITAILSGKDVSMTENSRQKPKQTYTESSVLNSARKKKKTSRKIATTSRPTLQLAQSTTGSRALDSRTPTDWDARAQSKGSAISRTLKKQNGVGETVSFVALDSEIQAVEVS